MAAENGVCSYYTKQDLNSTNPLIRVIFSKSVAGLIAIFLLR